MEESREFQSTKLKSYEVQEDKKILGQFEEGDNFRGLSWKNDENQEDKKLYQLVECTESTEELKDETSHSADKKEKIKQGFCSKLKRRFGKFGRGTFACNKFKRSFIEEDY